MTQQPKILEILAMDFKNYRPSARLTIGIVELSKERSLNLQPAFEDSQREWKELSAYIKVALGICEEYPYINSRGDSASRVKYLGEARNWTRGQQANFSHLFKKCTRAAAGILDINAIAEEDKDSGTLVLTGGDVSKIFGRSRVLLKEQWYEGASKRASYSALSEIAQEKRGKTLSGATGTVRHVNRSEELNVQKLCEEFIGALSLAKTTLSVEHSSALRTVQQVIDRFMRDLNISSSS